MRERYAKFNAPNKDFFYRDLKQEVSAYLGQRHRHIAPAMLLKIIICLTIFLLAYSQYINPSYEIKQWFICTIVMGFASMLIGLNIGHDAVHNALFRKRWLNRIFGFSFDLIGLSSYTWNLKHNLVHHRYPNVSKIDFDIEAAPFLRLSPTDELRWFHRYQHCYAPLVYTCFSLHLLLVNDLTVLFRTRREDIDGKSHPKGIHQQIIAAKFLYLAYMLFLPLLLLDFPWWQILAGFLLMHATLSLLLALVLMPSHIFEQTKFSAANSEGIIYEDWVLHQLITTMDFAPSSFVVNLLFGGFNTNVVHHLFPKVCHFYYRPLTRILAKKAKEHGLPYHQESLAGAIRSHFRALKALGSSDAYPVIHDGPAKTF